MHREGTEIGGDIAMYRWSFSMEGSRSAASRFIRVGPFRARRAAGRVVLGGLVCAVSVMCATPARAQSQVTNSHDNYQDFPFSDTDPCIGNNVVAGQGHFHQRTMTRSDNAGAITDFTISLNQNGTGANITVPDSVTYQFNFSNSLSFKSSTSNWKFTTALREHIISKGGLPNDNYYVTRSVTVSPNSPPQRNSDKSDCSCGAPKTNCP
jgi:hypothetical protein